MSNDPHGFPGGDYVPPRPGEPFGETDAWAPREPSEAIRARVQMPGLFLIIVAAINLLIALYVLSQAVITTLTPAELLAERTEEMQRQIAKALNIEMPQANQSPDEKKRQALLINWPIVIVLLLASVLCLFGGIGMLRLRWYGLSVFSAIVAAIPCVSCMGCCGLGEGIGIWALVVLLNEEVKAAFR